MVEKQPVKVLYRLGVDKPTMMVFADAVFSIAITLLVLEIRLPELDPATNSALVSALLTDIPAFMGYVISFFSIASWWVQVHQLYSYVHKLDRRLMWLTICFLFFIGFTPFATYVFAHYPELLVAYLFYLAVYLLSGAVYYICAVYANNHRELMVLELDEAMIGRLRRVLAIYAAVALLTVPIAYFNTFAAIAVLVVWNIALLIINMRTTEAKPAEEHGN